MLCFWLWGYYYRSTEDGSILSKLMITSESMNKSLDFAHRLKIPQMTQEYMLSICKNLGLSRDKMYLLGGYQQHYLRSWILYQMKNWVAPLQKYFVEKICKSNAITLEKGKRKKVPYWIYLMEIAPIHPKQREEYEIL